MKKLAFICTIAASILTLSSAGPAPDKKVESFDRDFKNLSEKLDCIGAGAIIVKDGKEVYSSTSGINDLALRQEITTNQYFRVGEIGRTIPAIAVMQLVDKGLVSLDADISDYLGFTLRNPASPAKPLTLRMLLTSTAGLSPDAQISSISLLDAKRNPDYKEFFIPRFKAGAKYRSASAGYVIAAAIVEKVSGMRFDDYACANIFRPMGISATYDPKSVSDGQLVSSYSWNAKDGKYVKQKRIYTSFDTAGYVLGESTANIKPSSGLIMNLEDLTVLMRTFLDSMVAPNGTRLLSKSSAAEFLKPQANRRKACMGLTANASAVPDYILMTATGISSGTSAAIYFNFNDKLGMAAFCNGSHNDMSDVDGKVGNAFNRDIRDIFTKYFVD